MNRSVDRGQGAAPSSPIRNYEGVVERIRDLTYDIKELRIRLVEPDAIEFVPGQCLTLETATYGKTQQPVKRTYSIATLPSDSHYVELMIRFVPGGICTTWVFTVLKEGDHVRLRGPYGQFRMSVAGGPMIWIAGGSGMAPFWSMIRHMREHNIQRPCTYFFGAVQKRDLFLVEELRQMEKELPAFGFVPALSAPAPGDQWAGETGLVTEVVQRRVSSYSGEEFYLCGSGAMVEAARRMLEEKGVTRDRVFFDRFR